MIIKYLDKLDRIISNGGLHKLNDEGKLELVEDEENLILYGSTNHGTPVFKDEDTGKYYYEVKG